MRITVNWKRAIKYLLCLNVIDLFTTIWFISLGAKEGNPLAVWLMETSWILLISVKLAVGFIFIYLLWRQYNIYKDKFPNIVYLFKSGTALMLLLYIVVVANNSAIILSYYV